ncbi:class IIb bacteriocin, lactobin A/cerein 7B family [Streptococcus oralis]|uniref:Bacteriocin n=2 Tax=Streptococcus oralis TaxID=1303 RepID=A0A1X1J483_STROR|nr:class IIb bacteriocin, lactobin A/cerein 7B family [Streptococcus oralis]ORO48454.1 bacteriocin [Streptococcus oralis subsp. tigurinus]ORO80115.1 bacteriocin [Streptococcus oralis subsp. dentisani]
MNTKMMSQFEIMDAEELEIVSGGGGNLGSAIGGCIGAVLLAAAAGPITGGAATLICVGSGIMSSL